MVERCRLDSSRAPHTCTSRAGAGHTQRVWSGSKNGSLIGAIVCAVIAVLAGFGTLLALLSGTIMFLAPALCTVACIAFAVILFLNYRGLSRNEEIARGQRS